MTLTCKCSENSKLQVLIITGGHEYEHEEFKDMLDSFSGVEYEEVVQPLANQIYLSDSIDKYDAIIYYDMVQEISKDQKSAFISMLQKKKGLVFLHHSLASYQD